MLPIFAVDTWNSTAGVRFYVATDHGCVDVYDHNDETVRYANLCAREYLDKLGVQPLIIYGAKANAQPGDIILEMNPEQQMSSEGYSISVSADKLTVSASDASGLLYGARDVLKQILVNGAVKAVTNRVPGLANRTVSLDNSRKYFSPDWIMELIREMSWAGMNTLVTNAKSYLTQKQFDDISLYAALYRVELVHSNTPANTNLPQVSVANDTLYIRCDNPNLQTPESMMEEAKTQLRALAAKSWNDTVSTESWAKIGDAPVIVLPDDSAVRALINEYYTTYLPKENTYTSSSFDAYKAAINNAEGFAGLNSFWVNPDLFPILEEEILLYRSKLTRLGNTMLLQTAINTYESLLPLQSFYSIESWSVFKSSYIACRNMLASRDYDEKAANVVGGGLIAFAFEDLVPEYEVAPLRKEGLTSAKFQCATVYQGANAQISVVVPRGNGINNIVVVDESGIVVAYGKAQPINIRKPKQVTYLVNIPATEVGIHTYTVYATFNYPEGGLCNYLYCSDPIQCRLTVLE
jgi:hypothetical protein